MVLSLAVSCAGFAWGAINLPTSEAIDDLQYQQSKLLQSESFSQKSLKLRLDNDDIQDLSGCAVRSQTALLLMEMRLAEFALRAGSTLEFDRLSDGMEARVGRVLRCAPRQSFVWLLAFSLDVLHGRLSDRSYDLLEMSYETSPNEGWIAIRRNLATVPLLLIAPKPTQEKILTEFQQLIHNGFPEEAARSYSSASSEIQSALRSGIDKLEPSKQKTFWEALEKTRS